MARRGGRAAAGWRGYTVVHLACVDDDAQGQTLNVIWEHELDARILNEEAWSSIGERGFDDARPFSAFLHTLRWNCVTATDPSLFQAPFRAGIRIDAYQLESLRKALRLPRVNLFIADDVGLGKTIEAGLIATELLLRRRVREIVVAAPPSMLLQWKEELESRFGLVFEILDRAYIERVRRERGYSVNPWETFPRFLISHKLLIDETYSGPLRNWLDNLRPGSLLILDEAHHAARFEHRLFLSATPHNGHSNSFSALLELLDPQRFLRGVKVLKSNLDAVMVRRLKDDLRDVLGEGFAVRKVVQVDIRGLPADAPELRLSRLLDEYRETRLLRLAGASKREQAEAMLVVSHLQQRLLSSIEAFARTLAVHRRTMERVWEESAAATKPTATAQLDEFDADDERSALSEDEQQQLHERAVEAATTASAGDAARADTAKERALLDELAGIADAARGQPDARMRHLVGWIREHMCPGGKWNDLRVLIFTEYDDSRRYLVNQLRDALANTDHIEARIEVFHGPTPMEKREEIKRAFNEPPDRHPLRILVATDAAREGINLQAQCWNLFHFDVPWNPSRLEQRNGRIDRKLQPSPEVFCHYFVYEQRPEDAVLKSSKPSAAACSKKWAAPTPSSSNSNSTTSAASTNPTAATGSSGSTTSPVTSTASQRASAPSTPLRLSASSRSASPTSGLSPDERQPRHLRPPSLARLPPARWARRLTGGARGCAGDSRPRAVRGLAGKVRAVRRAHRAEVRRG